MTSLKKGGAIALATAILLMVPAARVDAADNDSQKNPSSHSDDEKAIREQAKDYAKAFTAGDVAALANMWAADGTFTDSSGQNYNGRPAIEKLLSSYFPKPGGQPMEIAIESIKFPADNVAIEEGTARLLRGRAIGSMSRYTVVHVKENGKWQMASVSETDCIPATSPDSLKDLSWMVGDWTVKGTDQDTAKDPAKEGTKEPVKLKALWKANNNFIRCVFGTDIEGPSPTGDMQIIGVNPVTRRIVSWHFDSQGGFGYGQWFKDGDTWVERAHGVLHDGTASSATYLMHKVDANTFAWRSTKRRLNGSPLPDTQELTITRDQPLSK
jgi:uncharacterized protein (TIGR02246 family)